MMAGLGKTYQKRTFVREIMEVLSARLERRKKLHRISNNEMIKITEIYNIISYYITKTDNIK